MNTTVAFAAQATAILMGFFTRVIFTRMLSEGYVGINGLFNDILNILSLSELGVGTAITYALYGPIAKKDIRRQQILMRMFRTFYRATGGLCAGCRPGTFALSECADEGQAGCGSSDSDLSSLSFQIGGLLSSDL